MYFKQNNTLKLFNVCKMAYSCCFGLSGKLEFPDFLKKPFYTLQVSLLNYFISTFVFAFAPAVGVGIAFIIGHFQKDNSDFDDFPLQVLQGEPTRKYVTCRSQ